MTDTKELIGRLKEQCDRDAAEHCPDEIISLQREAISALEAQAKQIEALQADAERLQSEAFRMQEIDTQKGGA